MPNLSLRLSTIADFVKNKAAVCDVGTDHGYLAIHLIENEVASRVLATDINEKPLLNARKNIEKSGVNGIELRLCDGLSGVKKGEADTFIIAGMGGEVIAGILCRGADITRQRDITIILQPTTSPEFLRRFLCENGYKITEEKAVFENGKIYSVMLVKFTGEITAHTEDYFYIGELKPSDETSLKYIEKQLLRCSKCVESLENIPQKRDEFLHYKAAACGIEEILKNYGEN